MEISQEVIDVIVENKDKADNDILGLIIGAGIPFNKAKNVLTTVLVEQGLRMTKAQRDEKAAELMEGFSVSAETTSDEVADQIESLVDELDCTVGVARGYVRAAFVAEDLDMPKAPRASTGGTRGPRAPGFAGDMKLASDYAIANPEPTENDEADFKAFMDANGGSTTRGGADKSKRWYGGVVDLRIFSKAWKEAGNCA